MRRSFSFDDDFDLVVDFRIDRNRGKRCVAPLVRIERRNAHQTVHAGLGRKIAVGVLADDVERHRFDSGFFTVLIIEHLRLEAVLLGPSQIHAHEHLGPVLRLGAAGAGMNIDDRVQSIVFAGQQDLRFDAVDECCVSFNCEAKSSSTGSPSRASSIRACTSSMRWII